LGRKKTIYIFLFANLTVQSLIALLVNIDSIESSTKQIIFGFLRLASGFTANTYAPAVVLAVEMCGPSKRLAAVSGIYYMYIIGELIAVVIGYFLRTYRGFLIANALFMVTIVAYFW
jgi:OCT family organic cation transporter-like MFS transporter 4/5